MAAAKKNTTEKSERFTEEERGAMKDRVRELKAGKKGEGDEVVLAKIAEMPPSDRAMAKRVHEIVRKAAPDLVPKLWYGMPSYARDGKVVVFFQDAAKFKARYATLGFNDDANLDEGGMWATSFALMKLTPAEEKKIAELVKKAVG